VIVAAGKFEAEGIAAGVVREIENHGIHGIHGRKKR
jgi:hypothetical protein